MKKTYFSINLDNLPIGHELGFDLYVNASSKSSKTRFTRIFPAEDSLNQQFKKHLREKYFQVYVAEEQRYQYLNMVVKSDVVTLEKKASFIKDSAIKHLNDIFNSEGQTEVLVESIGNCKDTVNGLVHIMEDKGIDEIKALIANLSFHDFYTFDHSINVCMYAITILKGIRPNIDNQSLVNIGVGALVHDIGKLKVPTSVINKPSQLSDEEFDKIKKHPIDGYDLLVESKPELPEGIEWDTILAIVSEHHEHYDGSGYPYGKSNDEIHFFSKICMLADIFDALTTKRSYNNVLSTEKAIEIMAGMVGKKIDPKLFQEFLAHMKVFIPNGKKIHILDPKFDPSVPFKEIEMQEVERPKKTGKDYGKIIDKSPHKNTSQGNDSDYGKVLKKAN